MNAALRASRRQERRGAARYDGSVNSGSGNGWLRKNDVRTDTLSIEYKHTGAASYRLVAAELATAERNAVADGREMAFIVELGGREWVVLSEPFFAGLVQGA